MLKITWHEEPVPKGMEIRQVYGLVFDEYGRILMRVENKTTKPFYTFGGGTPEKFDKNIEATLRREMIEEVNTTLQNEIYYVGYQLIEGDGDKQPYAQVRMTAMIDKIGENRPDPDNGEIYDRLLVEPQKAKVLLNWGEVGINQIQKAYEIASSKFNFKKCQEKELWV